MPLRGRRVLPQIGMMNETIVWLAIVVVAANVWARFHVDKSALAVGIMVLAFGTLLVYASDTPAMEIYHGCETQSSMDDVEDDPDNQQAFYDDCLARYEKTGRSMLSLVPFAAAGYLMGRIGTRKLTLGPGRPGH